MKKILLKILIVVGLVGSLQAQEVCRIGLKYEKSNNKNWGFSMPVVTDVDNDSPAQRAGIKVGDIICSIDNIETKDLSVNQINQLLQSNDANRIIRIKNLTGDRDVFLLKECHLANSVSEEQLARAFSFYSLRDVSDRLIMYPIKFTSDDNFDFTKVRTFSFANSLDQTDVDKTIFGVIESLLNAKGLKRVEDNPDIMIDMFYKLGERDSVVDMGDSTYTYRFNFATHDMDRLPILNIGTPSDFGKYTVSFGVNVLSVGKKNTVVYSAKSEDIALQEVPIKYYACSVLPLMFRSFPFIEKAEYPTYLFNKRRYNYTGIRLEVGKINHIVEVDDNSPAYKAGIKPGDDIIAINGINLSNTDEKKLTKSYIEFIKETDRYRLPINYSFRDANGVAACRYWNDKYKKDISNVFEKNKYNSPFSYLFFFRDYINPEGYKEIIFEIRRNNSLYTVAVKPILKDYTNISIK